MYGVGRVGLVDLSGGEALVKLRGWREEGPLLQSHTTLSLTPPEPAQLCTPLPRQLTPPQGVSSSGGSTASLEGGLLHSSG